MTLITLSFDLMLDEVHRYEGMVTQFLGDGILALFGAPIAHEDHAQRGVRAALGIQESLRLHEKELVDNRGHQLKVRIGIHSGLVVVGNVGTDLAVTFTAIGDTVNLASRMQTLAPPESVVISQATERLVEGHFALNDLGLKEVKGKDEPVQTFEVLSALQRRSRLELRTEQGLLPLVGREQELKVLLEAFEKAKAGRGQVVVLRSEAGVGKSRLLYELNSRLAGERHAWQEGRCLSHGTRVPYLPILNMLKEQFGILETDGEAEVVSKVDKGVSTWGGMVKTSASLCKYLLSVDPGDDTIASMDSQLRHSLTFDVLKGWLFSLCQTGTLVFVLEDPHWIDGVSESWMSYLVDDIGSLPILTVLTHRPDYEFPLAHRDHWVDLPLAPLPQKGALSLARDMLGANLSEEAEKLVWEKTGGNPLFVEELTRSLRESGDLIEADDGYVLSGSIEQLSIPNTVQDIIHARIDRLPGDSKPTLQVASVIGRDFSSQILERVMGPGRI